MVVMDIKMLKCIGKLLVISAFILLIPGFIEIVSSLSIKQDYTILGVCFWLLGCLIGFIGSIMLFLSTYLRYKIYKEKEVVLP